MNMETQVLQALARGYCSPKNSSKIVDPDLIAAMAKEIIESFSPARTEETVIEYKTSISDLEKIEPLNPRNVSSEYWNATHENRAKLNEVIEKVNRIMEVMNRR
jgi:hypothetical protein